MSSKEVKNLLKEAREAIKNKEFQVAIKRCKEAIQIDKKFGMSYILLGAAYQETDKTEAAKCLKQAMQLSEDCKLLALQGLANCSSPQELPAVLEELLTLAPDKFTDYYSKLLNLTNQLKDHRPLINIFCNEIKSDNEDRKYQALKNLLNIFMKNKEIANEEYKDEFLECLEIGIQDKSHVYHIEIYQNFFKLLHQKGRLDELVKAAEEMTLIYGNNVIPLEWICKVYIENESSENFKINESLKSNFGIYVEKLLELNANSVLGLTASSFVKYAIGDLTTARDILINVNQLQPSWQTCLKKLALIHFRLRAFLLAEIVLKQLKDKSLTLAEVLIEQQVDEKVREGLDVCRNINELKSQELSVRGKIYLRKYEEAQAVVQEMKSKGVSTQVCEAMIFRFKGEYEKAIEILKDESHETFLELGKNFFALQKFDESLVNILKATKLDPNNSECFFWLGKIYLATNDETRSKKCFEKCLSQNPQNVECISILSAIYRKNKDWDNNLQILENSVKSVSNGSYQKSAFFQLGLHHLGQQNYDNAVTAFRNALRYDVNNAECWEALADAYFARGSYNSSLGVFEKSVELNPQNIYAKLQIAKIKFVLQQYQESIIDYEEILSSTQNYLPALKGIAESHFGRAHYLHENHRTGRARDHCQSSLSFIEKALTLEPSFQCLWRLLGNIFDFIGALPEIFNHLTVPSSIICEEKEKKLRGDELLDLASKCYSRCLKLNKENDYVWFNLVANYYRRSLSKDDEGKIEFLKLAFEGAKYLVKLKPSKWQNWNLLGIISATKEIDNPALAQHCFIKAITLDKKTFTSWSNLGVFYLKQGDIKLANKAFSRAQQSDTSFLNAWIGQAWIADLIGDRDEAMDLFRHCTQLGFHHESSLGYPNFVCSVLNEPDYTKIPKYEYAIDKMHAVSLALDNAAWHCLMESEATFEAWSYVGYLSKTQKLYKQAIAAYEKAIKIADGQKKDQCLIDLGFCYLKINDNQKAAIAFSKVKEATFQSTIGLALAFYRAQNYQECYETYQKAVEWLASSDEEKGLVLVAMAALVYAFQGAEDAKMVLFQCIGLSPPPVEGLLSLCAIGLLHKDKKLTELVTKELKTYERDPKYGHHVCFMMAQFYMQYTTKAEAVSYISSRIHEFPDRPHLRKLLALTLMDTYKEESRLMIAACRMAESSLVLRISHKDELSSQEAASILALASCAMQSVDKNAANVLAQKAIHICPMYHKILKLC